MKSKVIGLTLCAMVSVALVMTSTTEAQTNNPATTKAIPKTTKAPVAKKTVTTREKPQYGETITFYNFRDVASWDPADAVGQSVFALSFIYEQLGFADWAKGPGGTKEATYRSTTYPSKTVKGALAESWEWKDPLTLVLHIRHGVKFHNKPPVNGREMTAEDVAYCLNRYWKSPRAWMDSISYIDSISATDKYTVVVKMNKPFAFMEGDLIMSSPGFVYPPELIQQYGKLTDWRLACGTGPWMVDSFVPDSVISFKKNPDYWGYDELNPGNKLPYADRIEILYIKDPSAKLAALRTGKLDVLWSVGADDSKLLQQTNPELQKAGMLDFNTPVSVWMRCNAAPFNDVRVRQAMFMAINHKTLVNYLGGGEVLNRPFSPGDDNYTPLNKLPGDIQDLYAYKPDQAKQLLAQAGYPKGFKTEITTSAEKQSAVTILLKYWANIGVDCAVKVLERNTVASIRKRVAYNGMIADDNSIQLPWRLLMRETTGNSSNVVGLSDQAYDRKMAELLVTSSVAEQNKKMRELSIDNMRLAVRVDFPTPYVYNYWQPWLKGYHGEISLGGPWAQGPLFARAWVDQNLKKK
jgi:peptide/nickel transport system substrate-binding protein